MIDKEQWQDFRTSVLDQVKAKLDALEPVADAMDADDGSFEGNFTINGSGQLTAATRVTRVPLYVEDQAEEG